MATRKPAPKRKVKRGGFGKTARSAKNDVGKLFERGMKIIRGNPRTVEAVATRTIRAGEKFRIKVR
jgi:hypothetical protein